MFHGQTLKCATSDYDQCHVIAFRPISAAARSWSYDNYCYYMHTKACITATHWNNPSLQVADSPWDLPVFRRRTPALLSVDSHCTAGRPRTPAQKLAHRNHEQLNQPHHINFILHYNRSTSNWLLEQGLTSHYTDYRSYRGWVFTGQMTQPTVPKHRRK